MKSAKSKILFFLALTLLFSSGTNLQAAQDASGGGVSAQLGDIKEQLASLQQQNKEIQAKQDQIIEDLAQLRIWVHRK